MKSKVDEEKYRPRDKEKIRRDFQRNFYISSNNFRKSLAKIRTEMDEWREEYKKKIERTKLKMKEEEYRVTETKKKEKELFGEIFSPI